MKKIKKLHTKFHSNGIKLIVCLLILACLAVQVQAFSANSTGKTFSFAVTSGANAESSSSNFKNYAAIGESTFTVNSSGYKTEIGFVRTAYYLNGESCKVNLECAGGYCCSNTCQSSACPSEEEPQSAGAAAAGGGGGGGGGFFEIPPKKIENFEIEQEFIKAVIKQGGIFKTSFSIRNTGTEKLAFSLDYSALKNFILLSETNFELSPNSTKQIDVTVFASENAKPEVYTGNIIASAGSITKRLPAVIEVQAKAALFDIKVEIGPQHKYILKNESITANITLTNVGDLKPVDAQLNYAIKDLDGNDVNFGIETLAVYNKISTLKELELPNNISAGTYLFYAKVSYGTEIAVAGDIFYVVDKKPATCLDGIKNQDEEKIDCGGPCAPCKRKLSSLFDTKSIIITTFVLIILMLITLAIILIKKRKDVPAKAEETSQNQKQILSFIDAAFIRGYRAEQIKSYLISKKLPAETVDYAMNKIIARDRKIIEYIDRALRIGHPPHVIKKSLLEAGWPKENIERHLLNKLRKPAQGKAAPL